MPKEHIESRWFGQTADVVVDEETGRTEQAVIENTAMKVGWSKEAEHVELAVVECVSGSFDDFGATHMQIDRAGLNRLIRTLRKARDQAYGADA